MKRLILIGLAVVGIWLFASTTAMAIHKGSGDLVCGACHTMHNSQGGTELGGNTGGSLVLLRGAVTSREQIHNFCLQCHASNGAQAIAGTLFIPHTQSAPKVLLSGSDYTTVTTDWSENRPFNLIGAGGDFSYACGINWDCATNDGAGTALGKGHSLGATSVTPPGSAGSPLATFTCTSCHDPHGTDSDSNADINRFRNLRKIPTGSGTNSVALTIGDFNSWVGGITGTYATTGNYVPVKQSTGNSNSGSTTDAIWPVFKGTLTGTAVTDTGNSNSYGGGGTPGVGATGGISLWCANCHDNWHEQIATTNSVTNDWRRHPVDNLLTDSSPTSGAGVTIIDLTNYGTVVSGAVQPGTVLPVASGVGSNKVFYKTDATLDKVMCLSCHFAHGGPYNDNLRWNYTSAVSAGGQIGNGVPSGSGTARGCQLCHNRGA